MLHLSTKDQEQRGAEREELGHASKNPAWASGPNPKKLPKEAKCGESVGSPLGRDENPHQ
jgi:hypothetical protein